MPTPPPVFLMHHTHWDREWYEPLAQYQLRLVQVLTVLLDWLDQGQLTTFTLDGQTSLLTDALGLLPSLQPRLTHYIANGQLSVGPWFVAPDEWLVCGPALLRNLRKGMAEARQWGTHTFTGYLPDTFGHSADMPDILHQAGITHAMVWRGVSPLLSPVFWWASPHNPAVKVLVYHLQEGYFQNIWHQPDVPPTERHALFDQWVASLTQVKPAPGYAGKHKDPPLPILIPLGGDHLGPTPPWPALAQHPTMHPAEFMALLAQHPLATQFPTYTGDLLDNTTAPVLPGVWSARLDLKIANRHSEHLLLNHAEPALNWLRQTLGAVPDSLTAGLDEAWRLLMLNHPHDSICGCSIDTVHAENLTRFASVQALGQRVVTQALTLGLGGKGIYTPQPGVATPHHVLTHWGALPYTGVVPVTLHTLTDAQAPELPTIGWQPNPSPPETTGILMAYEADIWDVPQSHLTTQCVSGWRWVEGLPPHSVTPWANVTQASGPTGPVVLGVTPTGFSLSNAHVVFEVEAAQGQITLHAVTEPGNPVITGLSLTQTPEAGDSYNHAPGGPEQTLVFDHASVGFEGALVSQLVLHYDLPTGQRLRVLAELTADQPWVAFTVQWFNQQPNTYLQCWLHQPQPVTTLMAESHCGVVQRACTPQAPPPFPVPKKTEWLPPTGAIQRFIQTPYATVITQGLTEYMVQPHGVGLSLHRGFSVLSRTDNPTRNLGAGPPFAVAQAQLLHQSLHRSFAIGVPCPPEQAALWANQYYGVTQGRTVWTRTPYPTVTATVTEG
jgi:mannosylglycerate hydrolase